MREWKSELRRLTYGINVCVFKFFMLCTYFFQNKSINIDAYVYIFCLGDICVNVCVYFVWVRICEESMNLRI